jgi:hypothetical protein
LIGGSPGLLIILQAQRRYTQDYHTHLSQIASSTTSTFSYDHTGDRAQFSDGTRNPHIANKYYNVAGLDNIRHIFANGMLIVTMATNGANATRGHSAFLRNY